MPLLDNRAELVAGEVHSVEAREALTSADSLADQLELLVVGLRLVEISEGNLIHTSLQTISGKLGSNSLVDDGLSDLTVLEMGGGLDVVPLLSGEGIGGLLLGPLFGHFLTFPDGHD